MKTYAQSPRNIIREPFPLMGKLAIGFIVAFFLFIALMAGMPLPLIALLLFGGTVLGFTPEAYRWLKKAVRYEVGEDSLTIVRVPPFRSIVIPLSKIQSMSRPLPEAYDGVIRSDSGLAPVPAKGMQIPLKLSSGMVIMKPGWLAYTVGAAGVGLYASVTDARNLVLIEGAKKSYLISPEDPDQFLADLGK